MSKYSFLEALNAGRLESAETLAEAKGKKEVDKGDVKELLSLLADLRGEANEGEKWALARRIDKAADLKIVDRLNKIVAEIKAAEKELAKHK